MVTFEGGDMGIKAFMALMGQLRNNGGCALFDHELVVELFFLGKEEHPVTFRLSEWGQSTQTN